MLDVGLVLDEMLEEREYRVKHESKIDLVELYLVH
jgi:hypothetical protein